ncbi:MAG TPA: YggS family pyridoxal phosphate-dependent enzyme, partial [Microbacteriaceae bacterium]|nr:YggS family pyridoxal phosphate-dependent enzyme [Microbacteriaceae bacterium]
MDSSPGQRWLEIDARIAAAALANNRQPDEITTIVVTKFHP